jgi:hypothetical protein
MALVAFEITSRKDFAGGESFGDVGPYEQIDGIAHYAVDPEHERNQHIVDLELCPRDDQGRVRFSGDLTTLTPKNTFIGRFTPEDGSKVGVGMPFSLRFTRGITNPNFVKPETGHPAFDKACHLFGVEQRVIDTDPDFARRAMRAIEDAGRAAMNDLDHVLGLLRSDGRGSPGPDARDAAPQRTLADLAAIASRSASAWAWLSVPSSTSAASTSSSMPAASPARTMAT